MELSGVSVTQWSAGYCGLIFFFNDTATTEIYTLSLHDALPIFIRTKLMQDTLVYPICFLYRQYIELRLKEIIRSGRELLNENGNFPQHHRIKTLWPTAKKILIEIFNDKDDTAELSFAEHVIMEFSNIDPESFSFRYPLDKSGNNPLEGTRYINLRHLSDCISKFAEVMDSASMGISVYIDFKREMESYL